MFVSTIDEALAGPLSAVVASLMHAQEDKRESDVRHDTLGAASANGCGARWLSLAGELA